MTINIIGGGLAGCEAAWQAAERGLKVRLFEMKPICFSPAHKSEGLAELVCSNSLKADRIETAAGLLKHEMEMLGSLLMPCARASQVAAGGALAVDRDVFSAAVTEKILSHPNIELVRREVTELDDTPTIIATGPLTGGALSAELKQLCGGYLSFFDAAAPIVSAESLNMDLLFAASRYDRGEADYINSPMDREQYLAFYNELLAAERAPLKDFDNPEGFPVYEGCMPIEVLASRGVDTMRFGPMKPVGLTDPHTNRRPYAVVQLRRENTEGTMLNLVGFQTNLKFGEQKRVFSMLPGLENAEFVRYGVMHRNSFIDSPRLLSEDFSFRSKPNLFVAGQLTGVEGYMESAATGILAGRNLAAKLEGKQAFVPPTETMLGSLARHVYQCASSDFQPMGANMGILPELPSLIRDKKQKYAAYAARSIDRLSEVLPEF